MASFSSSLFFLLANIGVLYPPCLTVAEVNSYAVIHEEKAVTHFFALLRLGNIRLILNPPLGVTSDEFLKTLKTVASPM
jgi:hypothetical protein